MSQRTGDSAHERRGRIRAKWRPCGDLFRLGAKAGAIRREDHSRMGLTVCRWRPHLDAHQDISKPGKWVDAFCPVWTDPGWDGWQVAHDMLCARNKGPVGAARMAFHEQR